MAQVKCDCIWLSKSNRRLVVSPDCKVVDHEEDPDTFENVKGIFGIKEREDRND